ncbi:MAG: hypothetical protein AAF616_13555 [Bacteroidota bacterium]
MRKFLLLMLPSLFVACSISEQGKQVQESQEVANEYPARVGDLSFDADLDDPNFEVCNNHVFQYYYGGKGLQYKGEKAAIIQHFESLMQGGAIASLVGFVTVRFVVNCKGKTGRFRVQQMDKDYNEASLDSSLVSTIVEKVKALDDWEVKKVRDQSIDYYQYLTFKISNQNILEIMP